LSEKTYRICLGSSLYAHLHIKCMVIGIGVFIIFLGRSCYWLFMVTCIWAVHTYILLHSFIHNPLYHFLGRSCYWLFLVTCIWAVHTYILLHSFIHNSLYHFLGRSCYWLFMVTCIWAVHTYILLHSFIHNSLYHLKNLKNW
jgi:hypothetical protein